jgi:hypothetical protein
VVLLLGQRDREVASEGLALPLVAGVDVQLDVDVERRRLAGLQGAEVPARGGQLADRGQRAALGGTTDRGDDCATLGCTNADRELRVVHVLTGGRVREAAAEVADGVDGSVIAHRELFGDGLTRLQVVEVEVDRAAVVRVADAERHRSGVDVDTGGVGVVEDGVRTGDDADTEDSDGDDAGGDDVAAALGTGVLIGGVERGVRGHYVPFLQPEAASGISEMKVHASSTEAWHKSDSTI